jgi:hypothetical protein
MRLPVAADKSASGKATQAAVAAKVDPGDGELQMDALRITSLEDQDLRLKTISHWEAEEVRAS